MLNIVDQKSPLLLAASWIVHTEWAASARLVPSIPDDVLNTLTSMQLTTKQLWAGQRLKLNRNNYSDLEEMHVYHAKVLPEEIQHEIVDQSYGTRTKPSLCRTMIKLSKYDSL